MTFDLRSWTVACAVAVAAFLLTSGHANAAGGAFAVDDTEIDKPGECKIEAWYSTARNTDLIDTISPACVVNLGIPIELGGQYQRARTGGEWATTLGVKGKVNLLPVTVGGVGLGLSSASNWLTGNGQHTGTTINVPVTFQPIEPLRININAGWSYDAVNRLNYASWGAGFEVKAHKYVTLIGEVFGLLGPTLPDTYVTDPRFQFGIRITPIESFDLDLIYGRNIAGENANWFTVGTNFRF